MVSLNAQSLQVLRQRVPLFEGFTNDELTYLVGKSERRTLKDGDELIRQGMLSTRMFIVVSGEARVYRELDGKEYCVATLHPGATVGEMGVVDYSPRSAWVVASGETTILSLQQGVFDEAPPLLASKLFRNIASILAKRMRQSYLGNLGSSSAAPIDLSGKVVPEGQELTGLEAKGVDFSNADFESATFDGANFSGAKFDGANLQNADMRGANLAGALFDDEQLIGVSTDKPVYADGEASTELDDQDIDGIAANLVENED